MRGRAGELGSVAAAAFALRDALGAILAASGAYARQRGGEEATEALERAAINLAGAEEALNLAVAEAGLRLERADFVLDLEPLPH